VSVASPDADLRHFESSGVTLAVEDRGGGGRAIVLAHGLTATRRYVLHGSRILQKAGYRIVTYDARGHGDSTPAPDARAYGYPVLADDLSAVLDALGIDRAVLGGASMGAATTALLALEQPHALRARAAAASDQPRRRDDQAGGEAEALHVDVTAGDHSRPQAGDAEGGADPRQAVLGVRAQRVERGRAREERRERRRLAVEQPAAEDRVERRGRGEGAGDCERRPPARGERQRQQQPASGVDHRAAAVVAERELQLQQRGEGDGEQPVQHSGVAQSLHELDGSDPQAARPHPHGRRPVVLADDAPAPQIVPRATADHRSGRRDSRRLRRCWRCAAGPGADPATDARSDSDDHIDDARG